MNPRKAPVPQRLLQLAAELHEESSHISADDADLQLWYNRGYADGMISAMRGLGYDSELADVIPAGGSPLSDVEAFLPWGKAYKHGFEMGERETLEVFGNA